MQILLQFGYLIIGFILLVKGADFFVDGAASIARKMGVPQLIVGLTIVAMGTSLPEAAVSITSAMSGSAGITVGNAVGSNIINILIILGITAVITDVAIQKSTLRIEIPFMTLITIILGLFGATNASIDRYEGICFWGLFIIFLLYLFWMARKGGSEEATAKNMAVWRCMLYIAGGAVCIVKGSDFAVLGASQLARLFGMSERFIGLTIVALGTSLPELVTSVTAARKGNVGIAIGNIVGSNIFNILFVVGTTAIICAVPFEMAFMVDVVVAIGAAVLLWLGTMKYKALRRPVGIVMLLSYGVYFSYLVMQ